MSIADDDYRRFIALVAHELRSPGAVVAGYLRLLQKNTAPNLKEPEQKMIDEANKSCGRLLHIAKELGELAELSGADAIRGMSRVSIFPLCEEVVQDAAAAGNTVSFSLSEADRGACVEGNATRLREAIGSLVMVIARERGAAPTTVTGGISAESYPRAVVVFGAPDDAANIGDVLAHQNAAFDRWRGGTGLALPIAHRIVEAHRGNLWALPGRSRAAYALGMPLIS